MADPRNPNSGPPGIQYPKLDSSIGIPLNNAVRNIYDNLFYLRRLVESPTTGLTPSQLREVRNLISTAIQNIFNTVNNITNNITVSGCIVGSHALRLSTYGASTQAIGTLFWETDRHALYVIEPTPKHWQYVAGVSIGLEVNLWTDLGVNDTGFLYFASDTETLWIWDGTQWVEIGGGGSELCWVPMSTGAEPLEIMSNGDGSVFLIAVESPPEGA